MNSLVFMLALALPPACEQYVTALESCALNSIQFFELVDLNRAKVSRQKLADINTLRQLLETATTRYGADKVGAYCAGPKFVGLALEDLNNLITPLAFSQALNPECLTKFQDLRFKGGP